MKIRLADGSGTIDLKFLVEDVSRHGLVRIYFRRKGQNKIRLKNALGSAEFLAEYKAALNGSTTAAPRPIIGGPAPAGSLRRIASEYYQSAEFKRMHPQVQKRRRTIIDGICLEKDERGLEKGNHPLAAMEKRHVRKMRDELVNVPGSANDLLKALRGLFKWAAKNDFVQHDPAHEVEYLSTASDGFHTWTVEEVQQYEAKHPIGTKARLALAIFLFVGTRVSDTRKLGPQMERAGSLHFTETKGQSRIVKQRVVPILPQLREALDASGPFAHLAYLVTEFGKPFSTKGLSNRMRKWCDEAGLHHCSAHGLRKAGATIAAENGATEHQLMAMYGWESPKQAAIYTRKADRTKLTRDAMHLVVPGRK